MIWRELNNWSRDLRNFHGMQNDFDRFLQRRASAFPAFRMHTTPEEIRLTAEIPGVDSEKLEIRIEQDTLTISGERELPPEQNVNFVRRERRAGKFSRTVQLPYRVEAGRVEAVVKNGLLDIKLPRAEDEKPRKIAVKSA